MAGGTHCIGVPDNSATRYAPPLDAVVLGVLALVGAALEAPCIGRGGGGPVIGAEVEAVAAATASATVPLLRLVAEKLLARGEGAVTAAIPIA